MSERIVKANGVDIATRTLISSSVFGPDNPDLPPVDEKILAHHRSGADLNWSDEAAVIEFMMGGIRLPGQS